MFNWLERSINSNWFERFIKTTLVTIFAIVIVLLLVLLFHFADTVYIPSRPAAATISRFVYHRPHTTWLAQPVGKQMVMTPIYHSGCWHVKLDIDGLKRDVEVSDFFRQSHEEGDVVNVRIGKGRITGSVTVVSVVDDK